MMERLAGITSNTVPWEILRAAGFAPRLLENEPGPTPCADRFMEDVFERRIRVIFDRLVSGAWDELALIAISRASEQEHKLYLYLREAHRIGAAKTMPPLYLYNLLCMRTPEGYAYGLDRTRQMATDLEAGEDALAEAIAESNRARASVRSVLDWRERGLLEGSAALDIIAGFYAGDRGQFADDVERRIGQAAARSSSTLPRILIKGAPLPDGGLHRTIEQQGGYVIAEDDWRGSRAAGDRDIASGGDPLIAIFEKYFFDTSSPRVHPFGEADAWFESRVAAGGVDGVVFYLPLDDDVAGWDYPRLRDFLESRGMPSIVVRERGCPEPREGLRNLIGEFILRLERRT